MTSFLLFAAGAVIPIIPFVFLQGTTAVISIAALSAIALFTGRSMLYSGIRQVLFGLVAAAVFRAGHLIGVSLSG